MGSSVVRSVTPEEREYERYLVEIEARAQRVVVLRAEHEALSLARTQFEATYHARVGVLFVDLDRTRLAIDEYERRIARLQADPRADPGQIEDVITAEFRARREEVRAEEDETRRQERAHELLRERPVLGVEGDEEAKRLYRDLAKRFHPDLGRTDREWALRAAVMQRVNAAFAARDLAALWDLTHEAEVVDPAFDARSIGERLVWAIREVARLDGVIADLEAELGGMRGTEAHRLWRRQESGDPVIEHLEADLQDEVRRERDRLAALVSTYRHLLHREAR